MKTFPKNLWLALVLLIFSIPTHFAFYGHPKELVFDEVYFGRFASGYLTGNYYFDIHPPLGKLIISGFGYAFGIRSDSTDYAAIGNAISSEISTLYRFLPAVFATLLPLLIFFLCLKLNLSRTVSFLAASLIIFENSLITQSRVISLDSMLLFFGFASLYLYLKYIEDDKKKKWLIYSALLAGATFSIKWTGLSFPLLIAILEFVRLKGSRGIFKFILYYIIFGLVIYVSAFYIHFSLLTKPGEGDAFMEPNFQSQSFPAKFISLNVGMYRANANLTAEHDYATKWYTWPLMIRGIFYWQDVEEGRYIYLLGNPIVYWLGIISMIFLIAKAAILRSKSFQYLLVIMGFFVNFVPFIFIGRVMFLYHYHVALIFSILAMAFSLEMIKNERNKVIISAVVIVIAILLFFYFSPLIYGLPLSTDQLNDRMWLKTWR